MLTAQDILDRHSIAEYQIIYLGARHPSPAIDPALRYCVEESPSPELSKDRDGNVMIFDSETQAFEYRKALGIRYPVLAFSDRPMPDFGMDEMDETDGMPDDLPDFANIEDALG